MANVSIIGAGSWGTALAFLLHENGHQVTEWSAFEKEAESLRTEHRLKTLPDLVLPDDMEFTSDLERAMKEKDLLVVAVPSIYVRETARKMKPFLKEGQLVVNVAKGIEEATLMTLTDILEEGTLLLFCGEDSREIVSAAFQCQADENSVYLPGVVSRKKQMVPSIMSSIQNETN